MLIPNPDDYIAEWKESGGGNRKPSKNLWVYEKETGHKRYSITTSAGAKIQPYFDVPSPNDPNLYIFKVQGEELENGLVRIWISVSTERELKRIIGSTETNNLSQRIIDSATETDGLSNILPNLKLEPAKPLMLTSEAYHVLNSAFAGISDEHMIQLLIKHLMSE